VLFPTFEFLFLFLPFVFFLHESELVRGINKQLFFLTAASLLFVSFWEMRSLYIIAGMLLSNIIVLRYLCRKKSKVWFVIGLAVNLLPLAYFKYTAFSLSLFGISLDPKSVKNLYIATLPLAISFYSFVALTYVVDAYKQKIHNHSPLRYSFFVTFFPHLIAGPIVHHSDLIPQIGIKKDHSALFSEGVVYIAIGFCKKIFLADQLGEIVDNIYSGVTSGVSLPFADATMATLGYTMQLYFDFSGYSDMAVGLGLLFGYRLPINFNSPYLATSITDFWRRWHITLSRLMREYVYFPIGGSRHGKARHLLNLLLTMLVSGLWHGAGWTFILWGGLHGVLMCLEKLFSFIFGEKASCLFPKIVKIILTFCAVNLLWVLFRAESASTARAVYEGLFSSSKFGAFSSSWITLISAALILTVLPNSHKIAAYINTHFGLYKNIAWEAARTSMPGVLLGATFCLVPLYLFYTTTLDRVLYARLPIERYVWGVDHRVGDFRSNLFSAPIFTYQGPKVVIVGSSYTGTFGNFCLMHNGREVYSSSVGMGGNTFGIGLREALALLDYEGIETMIFGTSALNMGNIANTAPFHGELHGPFKDIGLNIRGIKKYSEAVPISLSARDLLELFFRDAERYQFKGCMFKLATASKLVSMERPDWKRDVEWLPFVPESGSQNKALLESIPLAGSLPADTQNGNDLEFKWLQRNIMQSIGPGGDIDTAVKNLAAACRERNIRLVMYLTPTVLHQDAPNVYPEGFLEEFRAKTVTLMHEAEVEFYDFSDAFPWDSNYMYDFIHPTPSARQLIHKVLLNNIYGVPQ
jgi:alginate O-acetyltransferase complex protein AlgI